jgi:hypothetical protein
MHGKEGKLKKFNFMLLLFSLINCSSNKAQVIEYETNGKKEIYLLDYEFSWDFNYNCSLEKKSFKCTNYSFSLDSSPYYLYTIIIWYSIKNKYIELVVGTGGDGFSVNENNIQFSDEDPKDKKRIRFVKWKNDSIEVRTPTIQFLLEENNKDRSIHIWFTHFNEICPNLKKCTNELVTYIDESPKTIHVYRYENNQTNYNFKHSDSSFIKKVFLFFSILFS